jgi:hypothetical protein
MVAISICGTLLSTFYTRVLLDRLRRRVKNIDCNLYGASRV